MTSDEIATEWPLWLHIAMNELQVAEIPGNKHEPRILEYNATTSLNAKEDEVPWCSSFVNWCLVQAKQKGTGLASARSWLKWGVLITVPAFGCITILKRGNSSWQGHVGFFAGFDGPKKIKILGGNQGDKVCVKSFPIGDVLGYRWI